MAKNMRRWQLPQHQFARRRVLKGLSVGAAGFAAATAIGCSQKPSPAAPSGAKPSGNALTATPAAAQPKRGGTFIFQPASDPKIFSRGVDPHIVPASTVGPMGIFYQTLLRPKPRTRLIEAEVAQKWEQPSDTEYVFTLAPNVKFHNKPPANGRLMTADDVVFSLQRLGTNDPKFISRGLLDGVTGITAPDKTTLKLTTQAPNAALLASLAASATKVLNPETIQKFGGKIAGADAAVGTGAFVLDALDDNGARLRANKDFWKPGLPYLDGVNMPNFGDEQSRWAAFISGQLQADRAIGSQAKGFYDEQTRKKTYNVEWVPDSTLFGQYPNTKKKPFDDPRVTRALRLLIDHTEAITGHTEVFFGRGRLDSYIQAALEGWDFSEDELKQQFLEWKQPKDDAAKEALSLLSAAGFTKDSPLKFALLGSPIDWYQAHLELLQAQFRRLSQGVVQASLTLVEVARRDAFIAQDAHEYLVNGMTASLDEPYIQLQTICHSKGGRNYSRWSDPTADDLIEKLRTTFKEDERKARTRDALKYLIDHAPQIGWTGRYGLDAWSLGVIDRAPELESSVLGFQYEHVWLNA